MAGIRTGNMIYNVGDYCRLSKDDGTENESASIATQKSILADYVKKQGWNLVKTYVDDGYSGTNFQRPAFQEMLKDIENGLINCVITKDLSRLGRNYLDCGLYLEVFFPEHNVRYIAVNDGVDTLNKSAMDITPFRNILNEMYSADVSVKIKSAYRARFQQGKFMGTYAPYGYIKDPADHNHLLIDDKVAHVVREIFDLALAGNGLAKIRKHINKQHVLRPAAYAAERGETGYTELPGFFFQREKSRDQGKEAEAGQTAPEGKMYPPLYTRTLSYAMEHSRVDDYLDSRKLNLDCKKAIEDAIRKNFDGMHLAHDAAGEVLEEYGAERVVFILANTVQQLEHDGRFSIGNKAWAKGYKIPENVSRGMDLNADYVINSHPAVLDGFIGLVREGIREQELEKEESVQINEETKGFIADGHFGTWHTAEMKEISGELFYRMEHEEYGDSVASIIVSQEGELVAEDLEHGFDAGAMEAIGEYFSEKGIEMEPEPSFIAQYYVMQNAEGGKAEREYQYFQDIDTAVTAYHQIPNHMDKRLGMESTEQPPSRMSLIECRNGMETLTDIEKYSLSGKWVREETMEASQKAKEYLDGCDSEIAYQTGRGYFSIQTVSDGYDYTIYGKDFREIDGGVYDNPDITIGEAMEAILSDEGIQVAACKVMDYEELQEKVEAAAQEALQKAQAEEKKKLPLISDRTEPEPALNGQSRAGIEETVLCYAQAQIDEMGLAEEVELLGARVYGSRSREGLYYEGSDIDVVVSYSGGLREDAFFNALHEDDLEIAGIPVDINPISTEKTGTLEEYLEGAEKYLDEKEWQQLTGSIVKFSMDHDEDLLGFWDGDARIETEPIYQAYEIIGNALERNDTEKFIAHLAEIIKSNNKESPIARDAMGLMEKLTGKNYNISTETEATITFYVAECTEFPVLGEYHERLETLQEAMELYEKIPAERMNGIKGIGFRLEDGSIYDGNFDLMVMGEMQTEFINEIPQYRESPLERV